MYVIMHKTKEPILAKQAEYHGNQYDSGLPDICPETQAKKRNRQAERKQETNFKLAEIAGVSDKTVQRYKKIQQSAMEEVYLKE